MNAKRCKWKKSREFKEGGALLMEKRLIYIDNQRFTFSAPPPLKQVHPHHPVSGGGARFVIFWLSGCYMHKTGKSAPPSFNSLDFFYCCPVKTKTWKTHLCSKRLSAFIMYCLSESLLVKTPSCLAGILPREGAGKASAERPNENFHAAAASCPFKRKDVRRTERGLIPLCEGWNINEKT